MSGLGRIVQFDPRDWSAAQHLAMTGQATVSVPPEKVWGTPKVPLNQFTTPRCVAYATEGFLYAAPIENMHGPTPAVIYREAQKRDRIPMPHDGTTDRAAMEYLRSIGLIKAYVYARDIPTIERWVGLNSPMLTGYNWYTSFDQPTVTKANPYLRILPGASIRGGHETFIYGMHHDAAYFDAWNSWGAGYGDGGRFRIPYETLDRLLRENGDACCPTEILKTP